MQSEPKHRAVEPPKASILSDASTGANILCLGGNWTVHTLEQAERLLANLKQQHTGVAKSALHAKPWNVSAVDLREISQLDTTCALAINRLRARPGHTLLPALFASEAQADLLDLSLPAPSLRSRVASRWPASPAGKAMHAGALYLQHLGGIVLSFGALSKDMLGFFGLFVLTFGRSLTTPHKTRWTSLVYHMQRNGVGAIPIVALLSFLIGTVLAYMMANQLANFGAEIYVVKLLEVGIMREMGVLITAILVAGRSGSSYTAQIGSMIANQEIDAMRSMGMNPMNLLVVPRIIALVLTLPMLALLADLTGLMGGMAAVWLSLDISPVVFINTLQSGFSLQNCLAGLIKAPFFALAIGCVGCFYGFRAESNSDSVGRMTTRAVVESIFLVIALNAMFALFYSAIKI